MSPDLRCLRLVVLISFLQTTVAINDNCSITQFRLLCSNVTIGEVLSHITNDIHFIELKLFKSRSLPTNIFDVPMLQKLKNLTVDWGNIAEISRKSFSGVHEIESLNLVHNEIAALPADVFEYLQRVVIINLMDNSISALKPGTFTQLPDLAMLNLKHNKIKAIPEGLFSKSGALIHLNLAENAISTIHNMAFESCEMLQTLDLSYNKLTTLAQHNFYGLMNLNLLNLSHGELIYLPDEGFLGLVELKALDLSYNYVRQLKSRTFFDLTSLNVLNLSENNNISYINEPFYYLKTLKRLILPKYSYDLFMKSNFFTGLLAMRKLDLSFHNITRTGPFIFSGLENLLVLNLSNNQITYLTENAFASLRQLTDLDLFNNPLTSISDRAFNTLEQVVYLNLPTFELPKLSSQIFEGLINLPQLELSGYEIEGIEVKQFCYDCPEQIKYLDMSNNKMEYFVYPFRTPLEYLNLANNSLVYIEPSISFKSLHVLNLTINFLDGLDKFFGRLRQLEIIDLRRNRFYDFKPFRMVKKNRELKVLFLQFNLWTCDLLEQIIRLLKSRDIIFRSSDDSYLDGTDNVEGIECLQSDDSKENFEDTYSRPWLLNPSEEDILNTTPATIPPTIPHQNNIKKPNYNVSKLFLRLLEHPPSFFFSNNSPPPLPLRTLQPPVNIESQLLSTRDFQKSEGSRPTVSSLEEYFSTDQNENGFSEPEDQELMELEQPIFDDFDDSIETTTIFIPRMLVHYFKNRLNAPKESEDNFGKLTKNQSGYNGTLEQHSGTNNMISNVNKIKSTTMLPKSHKKLPLLQPIQTKYVALKKTSSSKCNTPNYIPYIIPIVFKLL